MLTENRLKEIEARHAAASPGPAKVHMERYCLYMVAPNTGKQICHKHQTSDSELAQDVENMKFMAAAFDDVLYLVAEVRELQDIVKRLADTHEDDVTPPDEYTDLALRDCVFCGEPRGTKHEDDCPWSMAKDYVEKEQADEATDE